MQLNREALLQKEGQSRGHLNGYPESHQEGESIAEFPEKDREFLRAPGAKGKGGLWLPSPCGLASCLHWGLRELQNGSHHREVSLGWQWQFGTISSLTQEGGGKNCLLRGGRILQAALNSGEGFFPYLLC